ncbi:uncharacterized protein V6R79_003546 [Siganus canaliculatus]
MEGTQVIDLKPLDDTLKALSKAPELAVFDPHGTWTAADSVLLVIDIIGYSFALMLPYLVYRRLKEVEGILSRCTFVYPTVFKKARTKIGADKQPTETLIELNPSPTLTMTDKDNDEEINKPGSQPPPPYPVNSAPSEPSSSSILSEPQPPSTLSGPSRSPTQTAPPTEQHRSSSSSDSVGPSPVPRDVQRLCQIIIDYSQRVFQTQLQQSQKVIRKQQRKEARVHRRQQRHQQEQKILQELHHIQLQLLLIQQRNKVIKVARIRSLYRNQRYPTSMANFISAASSPHPIFPFPSFSPPHEFTRPPPPYPVNSAPSEPSSPSILSEPQPPSTLSGPSRSPTQTTPPPEQHRSSSSSDSVGPSPVPRDVQRLCQIIIDYSQRVFQTQLQQSQKVIRKQQRKEARV